MARTPSPKSVPGGHTIGVVGRSHKVQGSLGVQPYVIGRRTALAIDTLSAIQSQVKPGTGSAIAISSRKRAVALPGGVATAGEQGHKGCDAKTLGGFLAPAGTWFTDGHAVPWVSRLPGALGHAQAKGKGSVACAAAFRRPRSRAS